MTPTQVVAELLALSVVEFSYASGVEISIVLGPRSATITDTGRGMKITPDPGDTISHAERALTSVFPVHPAEIEIERVLTDLVWGERGSLGPSAANAASPRLELFSRRNDGEWSQLYHYGIPAGPPMFAGHATGTGHPTTTGTTIAVTTDGRIDEHSVATLTDELSRRISGLRIELSLVDDEPA